MDFAKELTPGMQVRAMTRGMTYYGVIVAHDGLWLKLHRTHKYAVGPGRSDSVAPLPDGEHTDVFIPLFSGLWFIEVRTVEAP
jgi:hypothetical protein